MTSRVTQLTESVLVQARSAARVTTLVQTVLRSVASAAANPGANTPVLGWDRDSSARRPYIWRSKLFLSPYPWSPLIAQVKALDYTSLTFKLYANGALLYTKVITSEQEFVLPARAGRNHEIELSGTSRVEQVEIADQPEELT